MIIKEDGGKVRLQDINYVKIIQDKLDEIKEITIFVTDVNANERNKEFTTANMTLLILPSRFKK